MLSFSNWFLFLFRGLNWSLSFSWSSSFFGWLLNSLLQDLWFFSGWSSFGWFCWFGLGWCGLFFNKTFSFW